MIVFWKPSGLGEPSSILLSLYISAGLALSVHAPHNSLDRLPRTATLLGWKGTRDPSLLYPPTSQRAGKASSPERLFQDRYLSIRLLTSLASYHSSCRLLLDAVLALFRSVHHASPTRLLPIRPVSKLTRPQSPHPLQPWCARAYTKPSLSHAAAGLSSSFLSSWSLIVLLRPRSWKIQKQLSRRHPPSTSSVAVSETQAAGSSWSKGPQEQRILTPHHGYLHSYCTNMSTARKCPAPMQ